VKTGFKVARLGNGYKALKALSTVELAEVAIERTQGQVAGLSGNLEDQAIRETREAASFGSVQAQRLPHSNLGPLDPCG